VSAISEDSGQPIIIYGDSSSIDNSLDYSGAVYLYKRTGSTWAQEAFFKASNADVNDQFGNSISLSGDTLAVGAWWEDSNQNTITNGGYSSLDNSVQDSGAVYVFRKYGRLFDPDLRISSRTSNSITLSWHSNLGLTNRVKIAPASTGTTNPAACTDTAAIALAAGVTTYTYSGLSPNTKYGFRVCAFHGTNVSEGATIWDDTLP
jgi:hypothetical protein